MRKYHRIEDEEAVLDEELAPDNFTMADRVFMELMRFARLHHIFMHREMQQIGVYPGQPQVMMTLYHNMEKGADPPSQRQLAQRLRLRAPTIATMLKRMENAGTIQRLPDEVDSRILRISLTESGVELTRRLMGINENMASQLMSTFTKEEIEQIYSYFKRINGYIAQTITQEEPEC